MIKLRIASLVFCVCALAVLGYVDSKQSNASLDVSEPKESLQNSG